MYEQDGYAVDITRFVDIQLMLVCDFYLVAFIGFELREENLHRTGLILAKRAARSFTRARLAVLGQYAARR